MKKEFNVENQKLVIDFSNMDFCQLTLQKCKSDFGTALMDLIESPFCLKNECLNIDFSNDMFMVSFWKLIWEEITERCKPNPLVSCEYEYINNDVLINVFENKALKYSITLSLKSWLLMAQTMQSAIHNEYSAVKNFVFSSLISQDVDYDFNDFYPTVQKIISEKMDKKKVIQS